MWVDKLCTEGRCSTGSDVDGCDQAPPPDVDEQVSSDGPGAVSGVVPGAGRAGRLGAAIAAGLLLWAATSSRPETGPTGWPTSKPHTPLRNKSSILIPQVWV